MSADKARHTAALSGAENPNTPAVCEIRPGQLLAEKYRVERILGRGGMGIVVAAEHVELRERVALKLMLPEMLGNADLLARFLREAQAVVKIKSEHVARVLDVGKLVTGEPYIVMEYLEGIDLSVHLDTKGPLPVEDAVELVLQACEAIAEAHAIGIIHRDLKPANLFLVRRLDGSALVKVLDFGISKVIHVQSGESPADLSMTRTKQAMGSPLYMPPEQMNSAREADMTSDIWALGAILFELITGVVPFKADSLLELRRRIRTDPAPAIREYRKDAPAGLEVIVQRCLQKDKEKRYPNVAEFSEALAEFGPERSRASVARIYRSIEDAGSVPQSLSNYRRSTPRSLRKSPSTR